MRNLLEFPITADEVDAALSQSIEDVTAADFIGGLQGTGLRLAQEFLASQRFALTAFLVARSGRLSM